MKYTKWILKLIVTCIFGFGWLLMCWLTVVFLLAGIGAASQNDFLGVFQMICCAAGSAILAAAAMDFLHALKRN